MIAANRLLLIIAELTLTLGGAISSDEYEISASLDPRDNYIDQLQGTAPENEQFLDISSYTIEPYNAIKDREADFRPQYSEQPDIVITPASGAAPLAVTLLAKGIEQTAFLFWELDWDGDSQKETMGQGPPFQEVTYSFPGNYFPVFNFYNDRNELIAQASGSITVTDQLSNGANDTGSQSQALTAAPGGWGIVKDTQSSGGRRPVEDLSDEPYGWSPPMEEFTEYLKPQLYASTERGPAPLNVSFDASRTYSRYGVMRFNYDVIWGPYEAEDDGYYIYSGNSPQWTHTFDEYGMYLVILDVEDYSGKRARGYKSDICALIRPSFPAGLRAPVRGARLGSVAGAAEYAGMLQRRLKERKFAAILFIIRSI